MIPPSLFLMVASHPASVCRRGGGRQMPDPFHRQRLIAE
jgi:hypothetical protein